MAQHLIVTRTFADYPRGARISDPEAVAAIRNSHNATNVVVIDVPDEDAAPAPAAA